MKQVDHHRLLIEKYQNQVLEIAIDRAEWMKRYGVALAAICHLEERLNIPNGQTMKSFTKVNK